MSFLSVTDPLHAFSRRINTTAEKPSFAFSHCDGSTLMISNFIRCHGHGYVRGPASQILTANFILFVANKLLCGPWIVCSIVDDSANHTQSEPSRSADIMRRESISTVTQLIAALCPYQKKPMIYLRNVFTNILVNLHALRSVPSSYDIPWMWWQSNQTPNSTRRQFYLRHPMQWIHNSARNERMWPAPCDFPTFASIAAYWLSIFVRFGRPQRPPVVNRVICQSTWPAVHWLHWSMPVATMTIDATVFLLDFVSNGAVALRCGMNRMLFYFHLRERQSQIEQN